MALTHSTPALFWSHVRKGTPDECWLWSSVVNKKGYGVLSVKVNGQWTKYLAHRFSFELALDRPIRAGYFVLHHCDTPPCVNPAHLYEGTALDNARDCKIRGPVVMPPTLRGEQNPHAKLTTEDVIEIRRLWRSYSREFSQYALAKRFGVSRSAICQVLARNCWTDV